MNPTALDVIKAQLKESVSVKEQLLSNISSFGKDLETLAAAIVLAHENGGTVLFCGNGGSAADAQHLSAELSGRFRFDRPPINAEALHCNTSYLTAVGNDYGYELVFSRACEAKLARGTLQKPSYDVLIGFSTSGNSANIVEAMKVANLRRCHTALFTGKSGANGKIAKAVPIKTVFSVPSDDTARIQECHITLGHILCDLVECALFGSGDKRVKLQY